MNESWSHSLLRSLTRGNFTHACFKTVVWWVLFIIIVFLSLTESFN